MSYILDALKKSQPEPEHPIVGVSTRTGGISVFWVWLLAIALVINLAVLVWFVMSSGTPTTVSAEPQTIDPVVNATSPSSKTTEAAVVEAPSPQPVIQESVQAKEPAPVATRAPTRPKPTPPRLVQLSELDPSEQRKFTDLVFTSHIFTDDADLCAVVINGQRLRNGDQVLDLKIDRITPNGVVFEEQAGAGSRLVEVNPFE